MASYDIDGDAFTMECPKCEQHKPLVLVMDGEPTQGFVGFRVGEKDGVTAYGLCCLDCEEVGDAE